MKKVLICWGILIVTLLASGCGNSDKKSENDANLCHDGIDNDGDGAIDCTDAECAAFCPPDAGVDGGDTEVITGDVWHNKPNRGESTDPGQYVTSAAAAGSFPLVSAGVAAPLVVSSSDYKGIQTVAGHFRDDIQRVTTIQPVIAVDTPPTGSANVVLVGTIGVSPIIDTLVASGKLDVTGIAGKWETFVTTIVEAPMDGVARALVIAGSDKRGTMYGMFDLSSQIGVSPWYFWADVPTPPQSELHVLAGRHSQGEPAVKYRGIFINHEGPCLSSWANFNHGGFTHTFYALVFELILRMKGNYLWPAMWSSAFYDDDPQSAILADEYGIVMGTSHHEPMMRAQQEWGRYGSGDWDYETNSEVLKDFWRSSIEQRLDLGETTVTVGMRGDGDYDLAKNQSLMESIIADQRLLIQNVTGQDPSLTPQIWTLYKDVQQYYDDGMQVPDDVTIVFSDDNWGNVRRVPVFTDEGRAGGHGIYYHFEYLGSPRGYRWLNSSPLPRVWEQMDQAYRYGADRLWIVNVGDIKPLELPIHFFLDFAWDPERWPMERIGEYHRLWAEQQFGPDHAAEIGQILETYTKYNARRKIELLEKYTYSLDNFHEAETIVADYNQLAKQAELLAAQIPAEQQAAYYELVLHPVKASAIVDDMLVSAGKNKRYSDQGRARANEMAERVRTLFEEDAAMAEYFNNTLMDGKWGPIMSQVHLGYTSWQAPTSNVMPEVVDIELPEAAAMGVAIEGSINGWPQSTAEAILPEMTPYFDESRYIDVFNRGLTPFDFTATVDIPYVTVAPASGTVTDEVQLSVSVDWAQAPAGLTQVPVTITAPDASVVVQAVVNSPATPQKGAFDGFVETNGYISIEAEQYNAAVDAPPIEWKTIPNLGRTLSGVKAYPSTAPEQIPGGASPHLEYKIHFTTSGDVKVNVWAAPTMNIKGTGLRYGLSFDDEPPIIMDLQGTISDSKWQTWVKDNIIKNTKTISIATPGEHTLKFWLVDPGIVLEKIIIETPKMPNSYLGPPSTRITAQ